MIRCLYTCWGSLISVHLEHVLWDKELMTNTRLISQRFWEVLYRCYIKDTHVHTSVQSVVPLELQLSAVIPKVLSYLTGWRGFGCSAAVAGVDFRVMWAGHVRIYHFLGRKESSPQWRIVVKVVTMTWWRQRQRCAAWSCKMTVCSQWQTTTLTNNTRQTLTCWTVANELLFNDFCTINVM